MISQKIKEIVSQAHRDFEGQVKRRAFALCCHNLRCIDWCFEKAECILDTELYDTWKDMAGSN